LSGQACLPAGRPDNDNELVGQHTSSGFAVPQIMDLFQPIRLLLVIAFFSGNIGNRYQLFGG
jgi:hypothetical protein